MNTFRFHEFDIPVELLNLTGGGVDTFEAIAESHRANVDRQIGILPDHSILEIGCGIGRDAIPLTKMLSPNGRYLGVDIIEPSITFCRQAITNRYPNFQFVHYNVDDQLHNPTGTTNTTDIRLPLANASVDRILAWSVFTHLYAVDIRHYLSEFRRVMRSGALAYLTMFLVDEEVLESARRTNLTPYNLRFEHRLDKDCYLHDVDIPLSAIAYREEAMLAMVAESGLELKRRLVRGAWSGHYPNAEDGQDAMVLGPPVAGRNNET